jgi:hypothetical protein
MVEHCRNFHDMAPRLLVHAKKDLLEPAEWHCTTRRMKRPNRCCRRFRDCLICFFADNLPDFPAGFGPIPLAQGAIPPTLYMTLRGTHQQPVPSDFEETGQGPAEAEAHQPWQPPAEELAQAAVEDEATVEDEAGFDEANLLPVLDGTMLLSQEEDLDCPNSQ